MRCPFQLLMWRNALTAKTTMHVPSEYEYEYDAENKYLIPVLMSQAVPAPELLNDMVCECDTCT